MNRSLAVVFDRDGTLLDFSDMFHRFILGLHDDAGVPPPSRAHILGYDYWDSIVTGGLHIGAVRVRDRVDEVPTRHMAWGVLFPGVAEAVAELAAGGVAMAVVSAWVGSEETRELLRRYGLGQACPVVRTRDDLPDECRAYPDGQCKAWLARHALAELGHPPDAPLVVVGDSSSDVELGRLLGARTIGVRTGNGYRLPPPGAPGGPDALVASVAEAVPLILT
jgi:phosphoglycolate phosphatase-like HAD superfamily hydrolase